MLFNATHVVDEEAPTFINEALKLNSNSEPSKESLMIESFIRDYLYFDNAIKQGKVKKAIHLSSKLIATLIGATAGIPYIESSSLAGKKVSELLGGNIDFMQYIFSGGVLIGGGLTAMWVFNEVVNIFPAKSEQEKGLEKKLLLKKILLNSFTIVASFISTMPAVYVSLTYNENNILFLSIAVLISASFRIAGYKILLAALGDLLTSIAAKVGLTKPSQDDKFITEFSKALVENLDGMNNFHLQEDDFYTDEDVPYTHLLVSKLRDLQECFIINHEPLKKKVLSISISMVSASCGYFVNSLFASKIISQVLPLPNSMAWMVSLFINLPSYCLELYANRKMLNAIYDTILGANPKNHSNDNYKKSKIALNSFAFLLAFLMMFSDMYVAQDNIDHVEPWIKWPVILVMSLTAILFYSFAMSNILSSALMVFGSHFDDELRQSTKSKERFTSLMNIYRLSFKDPVLQDKADTKCLTNFFKQEVKEVEPAQSIAVNPNDDYHGRFFSSSHSSRSVSNEESFNSQTFLVTNQP